MEAVLSCSLPLIPVLSSLEATMAEAIRSEAALAVEDFAAYVEGLRFEPSSSSLASHDGVGRIKDGIKDLSRTLVRIRASLDDAEEMEIGDKSVRL